MADYGDIVLKRHDDGSVTVIRADDVIGVSTVVLGAQGHVVSGGCVDEDGNLVIDTDGQYRYRPVRFDVNGHVVVCERVRPA